MFVSKYRLKCQFDLHERMLDATMLRSGVKLEEFHNVTDCWLLHIKKVFFLEHDVLNLAFSLCSHAQFNDINKYENIYINNCSCFIDLGEKSRPEAWQGNTLAKVNYKVDK